MAALWYVEGMKTDKVGTFFFRTAVITVSETTIPSTYKPWAKNLTLVRKIELVDEHMTETKPSRLKIHPGYLLLCNELTGKLYVRAAQHTPWEEMV